MSDLLEVKVEKEIAASKKAIFESWLDADQIKKFMFPGETMELGPVETNPVEGGNFLITMKAGEEQWPHTGTYKEISKYDRLVFTWQSDYVNREESIVTLDFKELENGNTLVKLHHVGFPNEESRSNHDGGWQRILEFNQKLLT